MTKGERLRNRLNESRSMRSAVGDLVASDTWRFVSELVREEAIERARSFRSNVDLDPVLARNLSAMDGALSVLNAIEAAALEPPAAPLPEDAAENEYFKNLKAVTEQNKP